MPNKRAPSNHEREPRSFDEAFCELHLTPDERLAMVWHLAAIRTRKLVETLGPEPTIDPEMLKVLRKTTLHIHEGAKP